ncbi:hypothetical protein Acr_04g0004400 [Actinidia rufa]|uniref:Uncharacterized protein n=1 Tax=Actinidia rufa TaxID=165716 RepID=A0A7J0EHF2_9ERIC|nr:hypothetical protein Acr_04g0004400 [Actinidia rufa]
MVSTRVTSFGLGLVFIFLALGDSLAHTHKVSKEMVMEASLSPSTIEKVNFDTAEAKNGKIGGRKMMEKKVLGKEMEEREEGMNHINGEAQEISAGAKMGGFMAFTADYHVAKSHPPKNN